MRFNKLVRDKIPEIIAESGQKACVRVLDESEMLTYLEKKLDEEVREFHESKSIEELADIFEVLKELVALCGASYGAFMQICNLKIEKRGGFSKRICLIETEERNNNEC
jgi:predicted house-cleaning noncanonical NTP pyrophosphatase (MazG superfamily)